MSSKGGQMPIVLSLLGLLVALGALTQLVRPGNPYLYAMGPSRIDPYLHDCLVNGTAPLSPVQECLVDIELMEELAQKAG